jgi:hypothetical protein
VIGDCAASAGLRLLVVEMSSEAAALKLVLASMQFNSLRKRFHFPQSCGNIGAYSWSDN